MTIIQLHQHGLDRRFGYKTKNARAITSFFRWDERDGAWKTLLNNHPMWFTDANVKAVLEFHARHDNTDIVVFGCCCLKCATPEHKAACGELLAKGIEVSHGLWPDHEAAEFERIERAMDESSDAVTGAGDK